MKRLTCEMCGSTDLIKENGVFVCQNCGTKYSVEEAKKMMVEGTVSVTGTVKIDETEKIRNLIVNAERAFKDNRFNDAESLYGQLLNYDHDNFIAILHQGLSIAWQGDLNNYQMDKARIAANRAVDIAYQKQNNIYEYSAFKKYVIRQIIALGNKYLENCRAYEKSNIKFLIRVYKSYLTQNQVYLDSFEVIDNVLRKPSQEMLGEDVYDEIISYTNNAIKEYKIMIEMCKGIQLNIEKQLSFNALAQQLLVISNEGRERNKIYNDTKAKEYWETHETEKRQLEENVRTLIQNQEQINRSISELDELKTKVFDERHEQEEYKQVSYEINQLIEEQEKLSFFKVFERKNLEDKIDKLWKKRDQLRIENNNNALKKEKECDRKINELKQQLRIIDKEIEMTRQKLARPICDD